MNRKFDSLIDQGRYRKVVDSGGSRLVVLFQAKSKPEEKKGDKKRIYIFIGRERERK